MKIQVTGELKLNGSPGFLHLKVMLPPKTSVMDMLSIPPATIVKETKSMKSSQSI